MYSQMASEFESIPDLDVRVNESMSCHTSMKVGGPADILAIPKTVLAFELALWTARDLKIPLFIMGNGTNLIVRDKGIRGIVIKIAGGLVNFKVEGEKILIEAGVLLSKVAMVAANNLLTGFEFAEGIPGTIGGAVAMNAGAYGGEMKDIVHRTDCVDSEGNRIILRDEQHEFGYRKSAIQNKKLFVVQTEIILQKGEKNKIVAAMSEFKHKRVSKQPLELPSAGSVFKRPEGYFAGELIQNCGLRGLRHGGAEISGKHCGFIVNVNNATAQHVLELISIVQNRVKEEKGVWLDTEVLIVGQP